MKISIIIEDKKKGTIKIPITHKELHDMYGLRFMVDYKTLRINNMDESFKNFHDKLTKVLDAIDDGQCYSMKGKKFVPSKNKYYLSGKKPQWKKDES